MCTVNDRYGALGVFFAIIDTAKGRISLCCAISDRKEDSVKIRFEGPNIKDSRMYCNQ